MRTYFDNLNTKSLPLIIFMIVPKVRLPCVCALSKLGLQTSRNDLIMNV